jgi:hypothetical protein
MQIYTKVANVDEAEQHFLRIRDDMQVRDEAHDLRVRCTTAILREWVDSGLAAPWEDIRERLGAEYNDTQ